MLALALFISPQTQVALDRYEAFMKTADKFETRYEARAGGNPLVGECLLIWERPSNQYWSCKWEANDFGYHQNAKGWLELDRLAKQYVIGVPEPIDRPTGKMNRIPDYAYPGALLEGDLRNIVAAGSWQHRGTEALFGLSCDHLYAKLGGGENERVEAWIDPAGALRRWHIVQMRPGGLLDLQFDFASVTKNKSQPATLFQISPPLDYVPFLLPEFEWPAAIGSKFPYGSWTDAKTNVAVDTAEKYSKKLTLVILTESQCAPTKQAESAFLEASKIVRKQGGDVIELCLSTGPLELSGKDPSRPVYTDSQSTAALALHVAATPTLFLVSEKGDIVWVWIGYDENEPHAVAKALVKHFKPEG